MACQQYYKKLILLITNMEANCKFNDYHLQLIRTEPKSKIGDYDYDNNGKRYCLNYINTLNFIDNCIGNIVYTAVFDDNVRYAILDALRTAVPGLEEVVLGIPTENDGSTPVSTTIDIPLNYLTQEVGVASVLCDPDLMFLIFAFDSRNVFNNSTRGISMSIPYPDVEMLYNFLEIEELIT